MEREGSGFFISRSGGGTVTALHTRMSNWRPIQGVDPSFEPGTKKIVP